MPQTATINLLSKQSEAWEAWESPDITELGYGGGAGGGKEVRHDTPILTDSGWKLARDISFEDKLVSVDGEYTRIVGIYPQGIKELYTITFDDGVTATVGLEHLWLVWSGGHGSRDGWVIRNTKQILESKGNYAIPLMDKSAPGKEEATYDPYVLGYIIANGTLTGKYPTIYTADKEVADYVARLGWRVHQYKPKVYQCSLSLGGEVKKIFEDLPRFSKQAKHIPEKLLNLIPEQRVRLLQGLMDGDGTVGKDGGCSYSTVVDTLAENVVYLVRSLGGKASIEVKKRLMKSGYTEKDVRVSHCGRFQPFALKRKLVRVKEAVYDKRYIKSITYAGRDEAVCFAIEHPSKLFVIDGFIVTHNSRLGCYLAIAIAEQYPKSRGAIARKELKTLRLTTLNELFQIFGELGYTQKDYTYQQQDGVIRFANGSELLLLDTAYSPQDPEYTRFGSLNLTWCWIEESNETPEKAKNILKTRVGRNNFIGGKEIKGFWLETFNPNKGHVYRDYYRPWRDKTMPAYRRFIRSLVTDNPYIPKAYITNLERADKVTRERLLKGNFDFDADPQKIMQFEAIQDLRTNTVIDSLPVKRFLINDIARFGGDKIVLGEFRGWTLVGLTVDTYQDIDTTKDKIKRVATDRMIPFFQIISDEDGVGGGVIDGLRGTKGFVGNASPSLIVDSFSGRTIKANFSNLRSQCYFRLAEAVNTHTIAVKLEYFNSNIIGFTQDEALAQIEEELDAIKAVDMSGQNTKQAIIPKSEIKEALGRSPDFADIFMMRMFFEVNRPVDNLDYGLVTTIKVNKTNPAR